jgi:hypothetical protein
VASTSFPSGSPRVVDDNQYEILSSQWASDGVIGSLGDSAVVYADSSGRQVKFRAGKYAQIHGIAWSSGGTDIVAAVAANTSGQPRIDLAVLGLDRATRAVTGYVKTGTAAASPVPPSLQRDGFGLSGKWEIPVAKIAVASGVSVINATDATAISSYIGAGTLVVADVATMNLLAVPAPGQIVIAGDTPYVYVLSTGWRRADWNNSWGIIGGREYNSTGTVLASGIPANTEIVLNMDSGVCVYTVGRRYRVQVRTKIVCQNSNAMTTLRARDNNNAGPVRACTNYLALTAGNGYETGYTGQWTETIGGSRYLVASGFANTGTLSSYRTVLDERVGVFVEDLGPAGVMSALG